MKSTIKKIILGLALIVIAIQFYRPNKYENLPPTLDDLILANKPTAEVATLLKNTCYDCHSNETRSYWYNNIVPVAWLVDSDVKNAKDKLNFSTWEQYPHYAKVELAADIMHQMYEGKMPLDKYKFMHKDADLTKKQQNKITEWINSLVE